MPSKKFDHRDLDLVIKIDTDKQNVAVDLFHKSATNVGHADMITCGNTNAKVKPVVFSSEFGFGSANDFRVLRDNLRAMLAALDDIDIT